MAKHTAYCMSCKHNVSVDGAQLVTMNNAAKTAAVKGRCVVCGGKVWAMLKKR